MAAKLTPMQLRAMKQRRNSFLTAGAAFAMVGGVYLYTMRAMSGARLRSALPLPLVCRCRCPRVCCPLSQGARRCWSAPLVCRCPAAQCARRGAGRSLDDVDIDKYRAMAESDSTPQRSGAEAAQNYSKWANKSESEQLGPVSATPSIAPGGNPMMEKRRSEHN